MAAAVSAPAVAAANEVIQTAPPIASGDPTPILSIDNELVLQVTTDRHLLSDGIIGYADPRGAYLPLGELARILDLALRVDPVAGRADGWFLSPERTLTVDLPGGQVEVEGRRSRLAPDEAVVHDGEIYVRAPSLTRWLPLELTVDTSESRLRLRPRETFPFEARVEREALRDRLGFARAPSRIAPFEPTPYRLFTPPAIDLQSRFGVTTGETSSAYDVRASGDLLGLSADAFAQGDQDQALRALRLTLGRRDPRSNADTPVSGLTEFAIGDVFSPGLPLAARSMAGRGAFATNAPLDQPSAFQRTELRGELPLDFEVELYRNDVLIGSRSSALDGRYEFLDVPLEYGLNILRLVFYGPRGETREEIRRVRVGDGQVPAGAFHLSGGVIEQETPLFDLDDRRARDVDDGALRAVASVEYGLSQSVTATASAATFSYEGRQVSTGLLGLRAGLGGATVQADLGAQRDGASAVQLGLAGGVAGWSYIVQHAEFSGLFADETRFESGGFLARATGARIDGALRLPSPSGGGLIIGTSFAAELNERVDGYRDLRGSVRNSAPAGGFLLSNTISWSEVRLGQTSESRVRGDFDANGRFDAWTVRAGLGYELAPDPRFSVIEYSVDRRFGEDLQFRAFASQRLFDDRGLRIGLSVARLFGAFDVSADAQYDTGTDDYIFGLRLGVGFGWSDADSRYRAVRPGIASGGSVAALVFRDLDGDGDRDPGEPGMVDAVIQGPGGSVSTDAEGRALLRDLGAREALVTLDGASLGDPYLSARQDTLAVSARPGRTHETRFAVIATGEIEARVVFDDEKDDRPVSSVALVLIDADGLTTSPKRTEYDGFVLFERVPPGVYTIALEAEQASRLGIALENRDQIVVDASGGVIDLGTLRVRSIR